MAVDETVALGRPGWSWEASREKALEFMGRWTTEEDKAAVLCDDCYDS